ncbi:MAG: hypothetical protein A3F33_01115 [Candidatus Woykebacteria bacterium RIFCSPHIGHO2_12_FULL_43_10]|uniref:YibE/F family protein n=2 Tax=Candidatus Woykeibacteriota TaxID=1817899 RepID=A0A1G1WWB5_9BACT|nr:MAG: hypothetical protein A2802_00945 [Candidatus Woykebacteria bacterium RIFCSPHIGHO2_01_FULL_43_29]OGY29204.1 MAG: hypothetical protein A3F33_01115 [Candidatus Woykebacteria bacterium RIFCSPHIGHO2_12_FULL_43_10]OGY30018.1 MAG: hypothetical protein A3J50_02965 [Candidatus Woykebacteria bacterium RIFCSPHIGHO2_02_FULL_43_16b]OGY31994.1 MAG: hypothetical protein A3A61_01075 [Candidatus Woykebacteria bacterium RIFCSPLOWO2_01_FULL_43_14]
MEKIVKLFSAILVSALLFLSLANPSLAQDTIEAPQEEFIKAKVLSIIDQGERGVAGISRPFQIVQVELLEGPEKNSEIQIEHGVKLTITSNQIVNPNDYVLVLKSTDSESGSSYQIVDKYRLDTVLGLFVFFFILVSLFGRWRGVGSFLGLIISLVIILKFIVPQILAGHDPIVISLIGAMFIVVCNLYLAHGFNRRTTLALMATFLSLGLTMLVSYLFADLAYLSGLGSDEAYSLRFGQSGGINFKGLLLGGMIIGTLGILDDVTTTQTAAVLEIHQANSALHLKDLIRRGMNIGREHIYSLVNTLVLAYAGASLPIFLIIILNPTSQPMWVMLNSEYITEEIVRSLAGSIGLLMAVPISTILTAYMIKRRKFL